MATRKYQGKKFDEKDSSTIWDPLNIEEALQVDINNAPFTVSMRTPGDDAYLIRGLLHSEDIIKNPGFIPDIILKKQNEAGIVSIVNVTIPDAELGAGYSNSRSLLSVSSCGICGKTALSDLSFIGATLNDSQKLDIAILPELFKKMQTRQIDFKQSGGTHAAAAFTMDGSLLCVMEDIGRHNAVDKVVGKLITMGQLDAAKIMTVSGRISYEIVVKCFKAKIPILAAVSAPSSLAVDYAKELGLTVFGFCREQRATCYAHPQRVKNTTSNEGSENKAS
ncbi:MAG TPA: formate dehydrogenase accessory sulfurtransferase FdhD [Flavobacteriaceae bacterium]|nr:formate dehydrogenase accessory sulfurtransferase FdhD [Flavobacteriaceae bacterium]MCB9212877.1 formate dehydrogenase accessory sulfurtransferase FdhD [Alteromonas sp.]HPF11451.1 formate dehydrogenase accessory sulfurtransferase FdhD [Flavobacteriaceae bacterium]HQU20614.1 formate dehydrogenase accessory sulfurtransferase FdhD [Flavobacteriaceae bacterium]HQU65063.1 formate dehydrogenase accessory sulfurtransferase FdhD [Flavobacteriaceae bacterium]